jgi:hypothetical protein
MAWACCFLGLLVAASMARGESIIFPKDANIVDVTQPPYGAKGDGKTDDTAAIQKAIDDYKGKGFHLYFPNGTYLVSDTLSVGGKPHSADRNITFQGQSEKGTIIKLQDGCPNFEAEKPVLSLYQGKGTGDAMRNYVFNLTVDTGSGNPGAIGIRYMSNNTGAMDHVTIKTSDPSLAGKIGLDMRQNQNGPNLVKNVTVTGFDHGIETGGTFALVFEHLTLQKQRKLAFFNNKSVTTIRDLKSDNSVPALRIEGGASAVFLVDSEFKGGQASEPVIINNTKALSMQNVTQQGYGHFIQKSDNSFVDGAKIDHYGDGASQSLFGHKAEPMRLPVEETPEIPWETDLSKWQKIEGPNGQDDAPAIQKTIDTAAQQGKTTVYFPKQLNKETNFKIGKTIKVHGSVNRIIGMNNMVEIVAPLYGAKGETVFVFEKTTGPAVSFERFWFIPWRGNRDFYMFENKTAKPVVIRYMAHSCGAHKKPANSGSWFIEDISGARGTAIGKGEKGFFRQFNPESPEQVMCEVDGGTVWILGMKTEGLATHLHAGNGAKVEIIGLHSYQTWGKQPLADNKPPVLRVVDSELSASIRVYADKLPFDTVVKETIAGQTKELARSDLQGIFLPLYRSSK